MRYLLVFCILLNGCADKYDDIKEVKDRISDCKYIHDEIEEIEKLYYQMRKELKLQHDYKLDGFGKRHYIKSPTAEYLERIGSPYVKELEAKFKEKDCYTYL